MGEVLDQMITKKRDSRFGGSEFVMKQLVIANTRYWVSTFYVVFESKEDKIKKGEHENAQSFCQVTI